MPPTVGELLDTARQRLRSAPSGIETREASWIAARVFGRSEATLLAHDEMPVAAPEAERFEALLERRLAGEPAAYLFGEKEFYGRPFHVDARVLIPRPETEHLVATALDGIEGPQNVLDVGTGSGCVAITLALEDPRLSLTGTDLSLGALAVAAANRRRHGLDRRLRLLASDLLAALRTPALDLVVANLPYLDPGDDVAPDVVRYEPGIALYPPAPNPAGTALIDRLLTQAASLEAGARVVLELGHRQLPWLEARAHASPFDLVRVVDDYAGIPRVAELRRRSR